MGDDLPRDWERNLGGEEVDRRFRRGVGGDHERVSVRHQLVVGIGHWPQNQAQLMPETVNSTGLAFHQAEGFWFPLACCSS